MLVLGWIGWGLFGPTLSYNQKYLYVAEPSPRNQLLTRASKNGVLLSTFWVNQLLGWWKVDTIRAGRYKISTGMSAFQLARTLRNGNQSYVKLSINRIRTVEELAGKIGNGIDSKIDSLQLLRYFRNNDSIQKYGVNTQTLLALALPYTYEIGWAEEPSEIIDRFHNRWKQYWETEKYNKQKRRGFHPFKCQSLLLLLKKKQTTKKIVSLLPAPI